MTSSRAVARWSAQELSRRPRTRRHRALPRVSLLTSRWGVIRGPRWRGPAGRGAGAWGVGSGPGALVDAALVHEGGGLAAHGLGDGPGVAEPLEGAEVNGELFGGDVEDVADGDGPRVGAGE